MFKKLLLSASIVCVSFGSIAQDSVKELPAPAVQTEMTLMEAINARHTGRDFDPKALDDQTISDILHVAWGITHDGKRTIPTARNEQALNVYAVTQKGAWLYNAETNSLKAVTAENLYPYMAKQKYMKDVPFVLIYTGSDKELSKMHAGSAYQNVGLYAASRGLNNVVRGLIDRDKLATALKLDDKEDVLITQAIGWPAK